MTSRDSGRVEELRRSPKRAEQGALERFVVEPARRRILRFGVRHVHGPKHVAYGEDELVVLCLVRDGGPYVKSFVEHYTSLGVKHLVFLDNGSTDGTVEALRKHDNVTVLRTGLPYKKYKYLIKQYLHVRFGQDRWSLYVDIDELFDYPYSDVMSLSSLLGYLNDRSYTAVTAHMLDMFPEHPLTGEANRTDEPLKEVHRFYDVSTLWRRKAKDNPRLSGNEISDEEIESFSGGIRRILFGVSPNLTKFPLVFSDGEVRPSNGSSHRIDGARIADLTCVLFHYKFLEHFHEQARRAVEEGNYYADSFEYRRYLETLERGPELRLKRATARELGHVDDLVKRGFLFVSGDYADWADREDEKDISRIMEGGSREISEALHRARQTQRVAGRESGRLSRELHEREREIRLLRREVRGSREARPLEERNEHLEREVASLTRQLSGIQGSRSWRLLDALNRARTRVLKPGRKSS